MKIEEANKIATNRNTEWRVTDRTNEIVEIEAEYRKRWVSIIAEVQDDWYYSSGDPENDAKEYCESIKKVLAVQYADDDLGEMVTIETTDEDLMIIDKFYRHETI